MKILLMSGQDRSSFSINTLPMKPVPLKNFNFTSAVFATGNYVTSSNEYITASKELWYSRYGIVLDHDRKMFS